MQFLVCNFVHPTPKLISRLKIIVAESRFSLRPRALLSFSWTVIISLPSTVLMEFISVRSILRMLDDVSDPQLGQKAASMKCVSYEPQSTSSASPNCPLLKSRKCRQMCFARPQDRNIQHQLPPQTDLDSVVYEQVQYLSSLHEHVFDLLNVVVVFGRSPHPDTLLTVSKGEREVFYGNLLVDGLQHLPKSDDLAFFPVHLRPEHGGPIRPRSPTISRKPKTRALRLRTGQCRQHISTPQTASFVICGSQEMGATPTIASQRRVCFLLVGEETNGMIMIAIPHFNIR